MSELPVFESLEELAAAVSRCRRCGLSHGRTNAVPGEGSPQAQVMFIGEGPGYHEDQQGRPFVGPAGQLLDELLASVRLRRADVFIGNVLKCRPPGNRDPEPDEVKACRPYLEQQLALIGPKLVVLLGRHALNAFFAEAKISRSRGVPRRLDGRVFLPVYHPAAALRQMRLRAVLEEDFGLIPKLLADPALAAPEAPDEPQVQQLSLFP